MRKNNFWSRMNAAACAMALLLPVISLTAVGAEEDVPDFSYLGAIGTLTAEQTQTVAESIYNGIVKRSSSVLFSTRKNVIAASTENMQSVRHVYYTVVGQYDAGVLTAKGSTSTMVAQSDDGTDYIRGMALFYMVNSKNYDTAYQETIGELDRIAGLVPAGLSDVEKALFLHEYIAMHYDYDSDAKNYTDNTQIAIAHSAYGMLKNGIAVCDGYAWLYGLLLKRVGISSHIITSDALNHAWNLVDIGGEWFHVDVTWDDRYHEHSGLVRHTSFLKDHDAMVESDHISDDWILDTCVPESEMQISSRYADGFWNEAKAEVQRYADGWLTVVPDADDTQTGWVTQYSYEAATGKATGESLYSLNAYWTVPTDTSSYYPGVYTAVAVSDGIFYCNTESSIFALQNGTAIKLFDLPEEQEDTGRIYGLHVDGDTLYYDLSAAPSEIPTVYSIDLKQYADLLHETSETEETTTETTVTTTETTTTATTKPTEPETTMTTTTTTAATTATSKTTATSTTTTSMTTAATTITTSTTVPETTTVPADDTEETFSVQDLVALNRYLLDAGSVSAKALERADLVSDGILDGFDLAMMKRLLQSNS